MRRIDVPVYIGVMKCTMQNEKPLMVVQNEPFTHQDAFRDYRGDPHSG
jgi:hypothetical protein